MLCWLRIRSLIYAVCDNLLIGVKVPRRWIETLLLETLFRRSSEGLHPSSLRQEQIITSLLASAYPAHAVVHAQSDVSSAWLL